MNCSICNKPIVLIPSAAERAKKDVAGRPASYFTNLFREHVECALRKREADTLGLTQRTK